jgi:hypothetical protein
MRDKVAVMTDLLEETFGTRMLSHRAGRWAFNEVYARLLVARGYRVDCSVTPHVCWAGAGGSDYTGFPERAYFPDPADLRRNGNSPLLEVPMTILPARWAMARALHRWARRAPELCRRVLGRLAAPARWLRPTGRNLRSLLGVLGQAVAEGRDHVQFMLHSSEFMPGGSPLFRTEARIETLYEHLEQLFAAAGRHFRGATLWEYHGEVTRRQSSAAALVGSVTE